jgi:hypothetical protein
LSDVAITECLAELRAACRRPIDEPALDRLIDTLRPNFRQILDRPEGRTHWTDHGKHMRDNGRYLGALADFFSYQADVEVVGPNQLMQAFSWVESACRVGAPEAPHSQDGADAASAERRST